MGGNSECRVGDFANVSGLSQCSDARRSGHFAIWSLHGPLTR